MRRWLISLIALAACAPAQAQTLSFSATGCGPYKPEEEPLLERYVDLVNADGKSEFLVHLGDIVSGSKKKWPEAQYAKVAGILKASRIPVLIVPGDNEWNDLDNPDEGWKFWTKHFLRFEKNFKNPPPLQHQKIRPENWAFVSKGVLFVGINLVGGRVHDVKEWARRMKEDNDWVRICMKRFGPQVRAAVVLAQAEPAKSHDPFFKQFADDVEKFAKPVLYLHADGHVWQVHKSWMAANLLRVQTDQVGRNPPVLVTVTNDAKNPFEFDRRLAK